MTDSREQTFLWQNRTGQQIFAELSNALYERELMRLSQDADISAEALKKRLGSMAFYIKKAAEHISELYTPLDLDSQNGSWISAQSVKPHSIKAQPDKTRIFYLEHAKMALVVPISVSHYGIEQIVLDTIDEIDLDNDQIHCNEHGWFTLSGHEQSKSTIYTKSLLKPSKAIMAAACCGHQWLNQRRTSPRLLSLREMLLASRINWRQFSKLLTLKK
ncbi:MAG: hypothetical protein ACJAZB_001722 [Psychrosphaera sp.]|jgi:hypothetical protein|uniref:Uncharacterized protein n=1 Tax=Psychrosphaera aquimarina TaxID=2044854 RepID=A0ABU3R2X9_9GAMM|nr:MULTISPECIES: hypothetical protein [Psychrosphaera]MBU2919106.1 hypothetical protein [Psychrosphaera sp. F3M07]MDU0114036.1 hypothetical protein [Psychrosphaera aquimarina]